VEDISAMTKPNVKTLFAGFGIRMAGVALDLIIAAFLVGGVNDYIFEAISLTTTDRRLISLAVLLLYFSVFWSSPMKATPAQLLFGMRVVNKAGEGLDLRHAVVRSVSLTGLIVAAMALFVIPFNPYFVVVALASYALLFLAALTPNRQAGHDLLAHSLVVNKITLKSPERRSQLFEHVSDNDPISGKQRRPSIISTVGNALVLGVPVFVLLNIVLIQNDMDMRYRTGYALREVKGLKFAVNEYYAEHGRLPTNAADLSVGTRTNYPDGGYYELEEDGVIRIRFTVNPELKKGSIVLSPKLEEYLIIWECRSEGDIARKYLPSSCRE